MTSTTMKRLKTSSNEEITSSFYKEDDEPMKEEGEQAMSNRKDRNSAMQHRSTTTTFTNTTISSNDKKHNGNGVDTSGSGTPALVRPIALKVIRPIPQKAAQQFYDESYSAGMSGEWVNATIMESHEWHRRWTYQEETGHTQPHDDDRRKTHRRHQQQRNLPRILLGNQQIQQENDESSPTTSEETKKDESVRTQLSGKIIAATDGDEDDDNSAALMALRKELSSPSSSSSDREMFIRHGLLPEHYAYNPRDRAMGAKNPSPEDKDAQVILGKRIRLAGDDSFSDGGGSVSASMWQQQQSYYEARNNSPILSDVPKSNSLSTISPTVSDEDDYKIRTAGLLLAENGRLLKPAVVRPQQQAQQLLAMPIPQRPMPQKPVIALSGTTRPDTTTTSSSHHNGGGSVVNIIKPVALRIARPTARRPVLPRCDENDDNDQASPRLLRRFSHYHDRRSDGGGPPMDIVRKSGGCGLSPLTLPSTSSSYRSKKNQNGGGGSHHSNRSGSQEGGPMGRSSFLQDKLNGGRTARQAAQGGGTAMLQDHQHHMRRRSHFIEDYDDCCDDELIFQVPHEIVHPSLRRTCGSHRYWPDKAVLSKARDNLLHALAVADVKSQDFMDCLEVLQDQFVHMNIDTRGNDDPSTEGVWLTLTKPTFFGCLGDNDHGDPMYTLGRMSFDMFSPGNLVCSLQGNFNSVKRIEAKEHTVTLLDTVPKALKDEIESGESILRTYDILTAFTIEPSVAAYPESPNKDVHRPIRGIMTTYGYTLADPDEPNRHSVWMTGGKIEPNDDPKDKMEWHRIFEKHPPKYSFGEKAKLMAVKLLMGAILPTEINAVDGSMEYTFTRPIGGHGISYVDTLYVDESLRIVRGHRGTVFVFSRLPSSNIINNAINSSSSSSDNYINKSRSKKDKKQPTPQL